VFDSGDVLFLRPVVEDKNEASDDS
jgi:hypothetical protein